jgi:hypothetical protein
VQGDRDRTGRALCKETETDQGRALCKETKTDQGELCARRPRPTGESSVQGDRDRPGRDLCKETETRTFAQGNWSCGAQGFVGVFSGY